MTDSRVQANVTRGWSFLQRLPRGDQLPLRDWQRRHHGIQVLLGLQTIGLGLFGIVQQISPLHIGWEIAGLFGILAASAWPRLGRRVQSVLASAGLITCSALLTHLSGGYIEAHFHFFVMLGVIVLYEDWIPFTLSILYVALHHGVVGTLDPTSVYNHPSAFANPWLWASIHAVFILWLSAALILYWRISESLRAKTDLVMRSSPTGLLGLSPSGEVSFANPAAASLLGVSVDELMGRNHRDFVIAANGVAARREPDKVVTASGELVPVEISTSRVAPELVHVDRVLTLTDIRERLAAERELQESEERFRTLSAYSPVGIFVTDVQGRANYTNPRCQEICGFTEAEGMGFGWAAFIHAEDRDRVLQAWTAYTAAAKSNATSAAFHHEFRCVNPRSGIRWANARAAPLLNDHGAVLGHVGTLEDVTDRNEASERLKRFNQDLEQRVHERTRELELAMKELESFNYSVSHDLRSPLRVISGFSELLLQSIDESKLPADGLDSLREIRDASVRMNRTVEALLHLSTINRTRVDRQNVDLSQLAEAVVQGLRREHPGRRVDVEIQPGLEADADPELMAVVLQNLLGNSWKFSREQLRPKVSFGAIDLPEGRVYFVRDNGVGFEAGEGEKLFRPFQRLHEPSRFEGSGIGLATVGRIIERHGGTVRALGAPREGAAMLFTLGHVKMPAFQRPSDLGRPLEETSTTMQSA